MTRIQAIAASASTGAPSLAERVGGLYLLLREEIFRFLTGQGLPAPTAQDVTQDVFLKLFVTLREGNTVASERGWLYRAAANRAVDYWRRERRFVTIEMDAGGLPETLESRDKHLEQRAVDEQRLRRLAVEIARLPKEQRMCVLLRAQGMRYREIAQILGVAISTTADWLDAAVKRLREASHE